MRYTLWQTNIAIENGTFIVDLPNLRMVIFYSYGTMLVCQRVYFLGARKNLAVLDLLDTDVPDVLFFLKQHLLLKIFWKPLSATNIWCIIPELEIQFCGSVDLAVCIWQSSK